MPSLQHPLGPIRLWIDDERPPHDPTWNWMRTSWEALRFWQCNHKHIVEISFDHDLGEGGDTRDLAQHILAAAMQGYAQPARWYVHSANPVGKEWLESTLARADQYWRHFKTQENLALSYKRRA